MDTGNASYSDPGSTNAQGAGSSRARVDTFNSSSTGSQYGSSQDQGVVDQVQQTAGDVVDKAKQTTGQVAGQVQQKAKSQVETQKDRAADSLGSVAQALRQTGQQLRQGEGNNTTIAQYADQAANQVDRLSGFLRDRDVNQLVNEVEHLARRQPALFLGGAAALGLVAARFLKSSSQKAMESQSQNYYQGGSYTGGTGYGRQYGSGYGSGSYGSGGYSSTGSTSYSGSGTGSGAYSGTNAGTDPAYAGSYSSGMLIDPGSSLGSDRSGLAGPESQRTPTVTETTILEVTPASDITGYVPSDDQEG